MAVVFKDAEASDELVAQIVIEVVDGKVGLTVVRCRSQLLVGFPQRTPLLF